MAGPLLVEILVKGFDLELHAYVLADLLAEGSAGPIQIPAGHSDGILQHVHLALLALELFLGGAELRDGRGELFGQVGYHGLQIVNLPAVILLFLLEGIDQR